MDTAKNWASSAADTVGQGVDAALGSQSPIQKYVRDPLVKAGVASPDIMGWQGGKSPYVDTVAPTAPPQTVNTVGKGDMPQTINALAKGDMEKPANTSAISNPATVSQTGPNTATVAKGTTTIPVSPSSPPSDKDWNDFLDKHYATIKSAGLGDKINDVRTGKPVSGASPTPVEPRIKVPTIPADMGVAKADTPLGSMPSAPSPASYTVKPGDNISKVLQGMGINPTPANIQQVAKLSGIKDANLIKPNQVLKIPGIKERALSESRNSKLR